MSDKSDTQRTHFADDDTLAYIGRLGIELAEKDAALRKAEAERDALAAAMPSEGADAAIGYAAMKAERDALRERLEIVHAYDGEGNKIPFPEGGPDGITCRDATIKMRDEEIERLKTELLGIKEYRDKNPLGGPAKRFDAVADAIRAGTDYKAAMADFGLCECADDPEDK